MKNNIILPISFLLALCMLAGCEDDKEKIELKAQVAQNDLQALPATSYTLSLDAAAQAFGPFTWTAPDFGFPAATSYTLQLARAGSNFASAVDVVTTGTQSATLTVGALNKILLDLGLAPDASAQVELRVRTTINDNVAPLYSSVTKVTLTPYAVIFPPLYMIGDATGGWDLAKAVQVKSTAPSKYETRAAFTNGGKFRFFATPSWDATQTRAGAFSGGTVDTDLQSALDGDDNFIFAGATGWYKITIDLKAKTIVTEPTQRPALYMIGPALKGWDLAQPVELTRLQEGLFKVTTTFTSGENFRFFTAPDWAAGTINYPYFAGGEVDALFADANDTDRNFRFTGATGQYTITVDLDALTVTMEN